MTGRRLLLSTNVAAKAALLALLLFAVASPELEQFQGKAMTGRAIAYPFAALVVPAIWWLRFRRRPYPAALDLLLVLPFLIDTAGNAADLYDSIDWWDDANHLVNWAILVLAAGQALRAVDLPRWAVFGLALGFGAVTHVLWELLEYLTFVRGNPDELRGAYSDTIGDMALSLAGSALAAALLVLVRWPPVRPGAR